MNQVIIMNKEKGMTGIRKIGHTGTLDPLATGVLVLLTGQYTKLNDFFMATQKEYVATVEMGYLTDTLDIEGKIIQREDTVPTKEELETVFATFPRDYQQEVPLYSAVKVKGKKLYQYARRQEPVELPKKEVHLYHLELLDVQERQFTFKALVSKGTYIRSLIRDLGLACHHLFTMSALTRTKQGAFCLEDAIRLEELTQAYQGPRLEEVLGLPTEIVDDKTAQMILHGRKLENRRGYHQVLFLNQQKEPLAIYRQENDLLRVEKMIGSEKK